MEPAPQTPRVNFCLQNPWGLEVYGTLRTLTISLFLPPVVLTSAPRPCQPPPPSPLSQPLCSPSSGSERAPLPLLCGFHIPVYTLLLSKVFPPASCPHLLLLPDPEPLTPDLFPLLPLAV
jgi:hypothetical protein